MSPRRGPSSLVMQLSRDATRLLSTARPWYWLVLVLVLVLLLFMVVLELVDSSTDQQELASQAT